MWRRTIKFVSALILREIRARIGNNPFSLLWLIIEPAIHVGIIILIKTVINFKSSETLDNTLFVISGVIPFFMFRQTFKEIMSAPRGELSLLSFPNIRTMHILLSKSIFNLVIYMVMFVIFLSGAYTIGITFEINMLLSAVSWLLILWTLGFAGGMVSAPLIGRFHFAQTIINQILLIAYYTSGAIFSLSFIPSQYKWLLTLNPITHILTGIRENLFLSFVPDPYFMNYIYSISYTIITLFIGLCMIKVFERWAYETP